MPRVNFVACHRGHLYADGNWAWRNDGTRSCLVCKQTREAQQRRARGVPPRQFRVPRPMPFTYAMARARA